MCVQAGLNPPGDQEEWSGVKAPVPSPVWGYQPREGGGDLFQIGWGGGEQLQLLPICFSHQYSWSKKLCGTWGTGLGEALSGVARQSPPQLLTQEFQVCRMGRVFASLVHPLGSLAP